MSDDERIEMGPETGSAYFYSGGRVWRTGDYGLTWHEVAQ